MSKPDCYACKLVPSDEMFVHEAPDGLLFEIDGEQVVLDYDETLRLLLNIAKYLGRKS